MNTLLSFFVGTAYAQGLTKTKTLNFSDFNFLQLFKTGDGATGFNALFGKIIGLVLTIAAITAFIFLLISGFQYITAGGDAAKATAARAGIVNALIGILVILISYVILRYVGTAVLG